MNKFSFVIIFLILKSTIGLTQNVTIENEIFPFIFKDSLSLNKIYPEIKSKEDLNSRLFELTLKPKDLFENTQGISILGSNQIDSIFKLEFQYQNKIYPTYSLFVPGDITEDSIVFFIIPGSGSNQSSKIYNLDSTNYQSNILKGTTKYGDSYIFVKPNEDFLAWYNGEYKLIHAGYVNLLLNIGLSYSSHYIFQAIATAKFLKSKYNKVVVLGCSQGGYAALIVSLKSKPFASIVSSGYSILFEKIDWSDQNQIIIPGMFDALKSEKIRDSINLMDTKFLFTYGLYEFDFYKVEATNHLTKNFFGQNPNISFSSDSNGHTFPLKTIDQFLKSILTPILKLNHTKDTILNVNKSLLLKVDNEPGLTYQWFKNDTLIANAASNTYVVNKPGRYKIKGTRGNLLFGESNSILVSYSPFISSDGKVDDSKYKFYNNSNNFLFELERNDISNIEYKLNVFSNTGQLVKSKSSYSDSRTIRFDIPIYDLSAGIYFVSIQSDNNAIHLKFIK